MSEPVVIGIDVGTTNLKLLAVDAQAETAAEASFHYGVETGGGGQVTQDPELWWQGLESCFSEIGKQCGLATVHALALSCQGETLVCCDASGTALEPAMSWMDCRAVAETEDLRRQRNDWYTRTGKQVGGVSSLSKILWLRHHRPDFYRSVRRFCQVADYLAARLTGRWICDINSAAFTNYFDVRARQWDRALCEQYELAGHLPEVGEAGTVAGTLKPELARRWDLSERVRLVLGGHDQGCAALGAAPPTESPVILSCGTAWVLYAPIPRPLFDPHEQLTMYCHAVPGMWAHLAAYSGGGVLDTFIERFCHGDRQAAQAHGVSIHDMLLRTENLTDDLIVIPYMFGAYSPENDPTGRAAILNWGPEHTPANVAMGIVKAISFETARNLELFGQLGARVERLKMMGGAGRSTIWPQMVADACGLPIDVLDQVDAAPLGAAYLAGRAIGCWPKDRLPRYPQGRTVMPDPEARTRCEQKFRRYLHAVESERRRRQATAWD